MPLQSDDVTQVGTHKGSKLGSRSGSNNPAQAQIADMVDSPEPCSSAPRRRGKRVLDPPKKSLKKRCWRFVFGAVHVVCTVALLRLSLQRAVL